MVTKKKEQPAPMSAQLKVRNYIINLLFHHANESVRIPSYNELAPKLGVARSSVQLALKQLIKEGFLVSKVGVGTFSKPQALGNSHFGDQRFKIVGIILGDGRYVYYHYSVWLQLSAIGNALAHRGIFIQIITLGSYDDTNMLNEITSRNLDGLIWLDPYPAREEMIRELSRSLPVCLTRYKMNDVDFVDFNRNTEGAALARELIRLNRKKVFISPCVCNNPYKIDGFKREFLAAGVPIEPCVFFNDRASFLENLEARLKSGNTPEAMALNPEELLAVVNMLRQYHVRIPEECIIVSGMFKLADVDIPMFYQSVNYEELGEAVGKLLAERMANPALPPRQRIIENKSILQE